MDFGMLRPDFERFLKACEEELDKEKIFLQTDRNDKYYTFNFAKLRLNGTKIVEEFSLDVNINKGIFIDILPMDAVADNIVKAKIQCRSFWFYRNLLWVKCGYGSEEQKKAKAYKIAKFLSKAFTIESLKKHKERAIRKYEGKSTKKVVTGDGSYGLEKETIKKAFVTHLSEYQFEDRTYPGIADYEDFLSHFYGDYMQLPPEEERNHHGRLDVDFGRYAELWDKKS
jgi:lipopolysaccharide cholinephosphotransferase